MEARERRMNHKEMRRIGKVKEIANTKAVNIVKELLMKWMRMIANQEDKIRTIKAIAVMR